MNLSEAFKEFIVKYDEQQHKNVKGLIYLYTDNYYRQINQHTVSFFNNYNEQQRAPTNFFCFLKIKPLPRLIMTIKAHDAYRLSAQPLTFTIQQFNCELFGAFVNWSLSVQTHDMPDLILWRYGLAQTSPSQTQALTLPCWMSTSTSFEVALKFSGHMDAISKGVFYKIIVPSSQIRNIIPIDKISCDDEECEVILPVGAQLLRIGDGVEKNVRDPSKTVKYTEYTFSYEEDDKDTLQRALCLAGPIDFKKTGGASDEPVIKCVPITDRWAMDIQQIGNGTCKNCTSTSLVKRYFTGKENSPLGKGYSSYFESVGKKRMGRDGNKWIVIATVNGNKRWKKYNVLNIDKFKYIDYNK